MSLLRGAALGVGAVVVIAGCASSSREIAPAYVSPMHFEGYSCDQLVAENQRIQSRIGQAAGNVDERASSDRVRMGVGLVLFWPALFFVRGDGPEAQEYARLQGEHQALEQAYIRKDCASRGADEPDSMSGVAGEEAASVEATASATATSGAPSAGRLMSSTSSLRLVVGGTELIGRSCVVRSGGYHEAVLSGGLFAAPIGNNLDVTCSLPDGDTARASVPPSEDGTFPPIVLVEID